MWFSLAVDAVCFVGFVGVVEGSSAVLPSAVAVEGDDDEGFAAAHVRFRPSAAHLSAVHACSGWPCSSVGDWLQTMIAGSSGSRGRICAMRVPGYTIS